MIAIHEIQPAARQAVAHFLNRPTMPAIGEDCGVELTLTDWLEQCHAPYRAGVVDRALGRKPRLMNCAVDENDRQSYDAGFADAWMAMRVADAKRTGGAIGLNLNDYRYF